MMLIRQLNHKNKLKYNTRSRSDTSDTSYLQKCSPNVMCCFWSPCQKSYSCKKSSFFTFTAPPSHSHFQFKNSPGYPQMRWSNSRWLLKFPELISEHCLDQRQFPWPDKQLLLIPKISGPDIRELKNHDEVHDDDVCWLGKDWNENVGFGGKKES